MLGVPVFYEVLGGSLALMTHLPRLGLAGGVSPLAPIFLTKAGLRAKRRKNTCLDSEEIPFDCHEAFDSKNLPFLKKPFGSKKK
jgi:hypothetical protein